MEGLRGAGFDVVRVVDVLATESDEEILARALEWGRVIITADRDFGELVVRLGRPTLGVVNLALGELSSALGAKIVVAGLRRLGQRVARSLVTIEPNRIRVRPLTAP